MLELVLRRVEVKRNNVWTICRMVEVKKGEVFRLYENNDRELMTDAGRSEFVAADDGWTNENDIGTILVDDEPPGPVQPK